MKIAIISLLFLVMFLSGNVNAADYSVWADLEAMSSSLTQPINFTFGVNTGSPSVKEVDIKMPSGFTYGGNVGTDVSGATFVLSGDTLRWYNVEIPADSVNYFWFRTTASNEIGEKDFNVTAIDTNDDSVLTTVPIILQDTIGPRWFTPSISPSSPATYSPGKNYYFSITWSDNVAMSNVLFENNFTGSLQNYSVLNTSNSFFYYNYYDLPATNYTWKFYGTDTYGNQNATPLYILAVRKASNPVTLTINNVTNKNTNGYYSYPVYVDVNVLGSGIASLLQDNVLVASGPGTSLSYSTSSLSFGNHTFKATIVSAINTNYTENSTGTSYNVNIIYPPPIPSPKMTITSTYSPEYKSTFSIDWSDPFDPNVFNTSLIELNITGSAKNYTMTRDGNTATLSMALPAGTFYWKVYGNNQYGSWASTGKTIFTISKAEPALSLKTTPNWIVTPSTQTSVSCNAPTGYTVNLYRNNTKVANPDNQKFLAPSGYVYICNLTAATQNYTAGFEGRLLRITNDLGDITNVDLIAKDVSISVTQGSSTFTNFKFINNGAVTQKITPTIKGLDKKYYSISPLSTDVNPGDTGSFDVTFAIDNLYPVGQKDIQFMAVVNNVTLSKTFGLKVLPSEQTANSLIDDLSNIKTQIDILGKQIDQLQADSKDISTIDTLYSSLQLDATRIENYLEQKDYFNAAVVTSSAKATMGQLKTSIESPNSAVNQAVEPASKTSPLLIVGLLVLAGGLFFVAYKFVYLKMAMKKNWDGLKKKWETKQ